MQERKDELDILMSDKVDFLSNKIIREKGNILY